MFRDILRLLYQARETPQMSSQFAMSAMSVVEFLLWATLAFMFWKKSLSRRFPAMATYLGLHLVSTPILLLLLYEETKHASSSFLFSSYFYGYFGV